MNDQIKLRLIANSESLVKSASYLEGSLNNDNKIGIKEVYSMPELCEFESLSGRFVRSSDNYKQAVSGQALSWQPISGGR